MGERAKTKMISKYKKLVNKLDKQGAQDPRALAAWIGRKKYGKKEFQARARRGLGKR
jgi:hypothetical protein